MYGGVLVYNDLDKRNNVQDVPARSREWRGMATVVLKERESGTLGKWNAGIHGRKWVHQLFIMFMCNTWLQMGSPTINNLYCNTWLLSTPVTRAVRVSDSQSMIA